MTIRKAQPRDLNHIEQLLQRADLPTLGVREHLTSYLVAEDESRVVGAIGLELYGDTALLRSAVVAPEMQGRGTGSLLYEHLLREAREKGVSRLLLLTNTAEEYFAKKGFRPIPQKSVTGPVTQSVEFSGACPAHAVCMELLLSTVPGR